MGFRPVGNVRLATNRDRMDEYRFYAGVARTIGVRVEFLTPSEVREIWPLCNVDGIVGAILHPEDGYIQPADPHPSLRTAAPAPAGPRSIGARRWSPSSGPGAGSGGCGRTGATSSASTW